MGFMLHAAETAMDSGVVRQVAREWRTARHSISFQTDECIVVFCYVSLLIFLSWQANCYACTYKNASVSGHFDLKVKLPNIHSRRVDSQLGAFL